MAEIGHSSSEVKEGINEQLRARAIDCHFSGSIWSRSNFQER